MYIIICRFNTLLYLNLAMFECFECSILKTKSLKRLPLLVLLASAALFLNCAVFEQAGCLFFGILKKMWNDAALGRSRILPQMVCGKIQGFY
jgi:hypothetical protein